MNTPATADELRAQRKQEAARHAASFVEPGMVVGLGTGSTSAFFIDELGRRWNREGLRFKGIPTSERSAQQARELGIELTDFSEQTRIDLAVDGADEVLRGRLTLIKGLGGALLREKIVAHAADRFVVIVDDKKLVDKLGTTAPVPVEVTPFGWECAAERLGRLGARAPKPRMDRNGQLYVTDGGNMIIDCHFGPIEDPLYLFTEIAKIVGVIESGMFLDDVSEVLVATEHGIDRLTATERRV
jgi:ribose 5-phosphate isomerase A